MRSDLITSYKDLLQKESPENGTSEGVVGAGEDDGWAVLR